MLSVPGPVTSLSASDPGAVVSKAGSGSSAVVVVVVVNGEVDLGVGPNGGLYEICLS